MVSEVSAAIEKLKKLASFSSPDGFPSVVVGWDDATPGRVGTYVVNRDGRQPGAVVLLTRTD
jgi:hypothetical protein